MPGAIHHLRASINLLLLVISLICWGVPAHLPPLMRLLLPHKGWKKFWTAAADRILSSWVGFIALGIRLLLGIRWDIQGANNLSTNRWYVVNANHQAWTDIPVLIKVFSGRIPELLTRGDYLQDPEYKKEFQDWLNRQWEQKDARIGRLLLNRG